MRDHLMSEHDAVDLATAQSRFQQMNVDQFGTFRDVVDFAHHCLERIQWSQLNLEFDTDDEENAMFAIFDKKS